MTKGASKNPSAQILIEYHTNEICKSETQASLIFFPAITSLRTCTLHQCYRLNVCICLPPNSYIEILTPNMIFFLGGRSLGGDYVTRKGRVFMDGFRTL